MLASTRASSTLRVPMPTPFSTLSEYASKSLLADFGVPCNREVLVAAPEEAAGPLLRLDSRWP